MDAELLQSEVVTLKKEIEVLKASILESQRAFDESHVWFKKVFESSLLGNKIISADLKILQANQAMADLLGYDNPEEIIGNRITDHTPIEYLEDWKALQQQLWNQSMASFSLETCLIKKDGSAIWCQVTSILFKINDANYGFLL